MLRYQIRAVKETDLEEVSRVEEVCFPKAEAADKESFLERIRTFPESFFVAEEESGNLIGFINGAMTSSDRIYDEMFEKAALHEKDGAFQSIFGLDVVPEYRRQGIAAALMNHMIQETQKRGKRGLILTCKEHLIPYYEKFGYRNLGVSGSVHGGAVWYDMILDWREPLEENAEQCDTSSGMFKVECGQ